MGGDRAGVLPLGRIGRAAGMDGGGDMKHANFTQAMRAHGVRRIERHEPTAEVPYEWFAVQLDDAILPGTGRTVAEAFENALQWIRRAA